MAFYRVQTKNNSSGVFAGITSQTLAQASVPTANNLIVLHIQCGLNSGGASSADPTSVTDTQTNVYTKCVAVHAPAGTNPSDSYIYACLNAKGGGASNTITVQFGASQSFIS